MIIKQPAMYDTSYWENISDFNLLSPRPLMVSTRATYGTWVDPKFFQYITDIQADGIHDSCYHYLRTTESANTQAHFFCQTIRPYIKPKTILELDIEEEGITAIMMGTFIEIVRSYFTNMVWIYGRKEMLDRIVMTEAQKTYFRNIPIWTAGYPYDPDLYSQPPAWYIPDQTKYGKVWAWQYSESAIIQGADSAIDANWMSPELISYLEPQPGVTMKQGTALLDLNIRSGAGTTYPLIGLLRKGDKVYGDVDVATNWFHFYKIERLAGGTETMDGWSSAYPQYMTVVDYIPPVTTKTTTVKVTYDSTDAPIAVNVDGSEWRKQ